VLPPVNRRLDVDAHVPVRARGDFSDVDLWTCRTGRLGRGLSNRNRARLRRGTRIWRCRRLCGLGGSAGHAQQQNGHQSARNISKSVDHRCPLTGNSLSRRLTVDVVDNKANVRFRRLVGMGMTQPCRYSLPQSGVPPGAIRVRAKSASPLVREAVPITRRGTIRAGCWRDLVRPARPVANRAHRRNNLGRLARGRSRGAITRLGCWHGAFGEHVRSISEHFWIDGGRMRGRARDRLA
jgi:hypothetical protein